MPMKILKTPALENLGPQTFPFHGDKGISVSKPVILCNTVTMPQCPETLSEAVLRYCGGYHVNLTGSCCPDTGSNIIVGVSVKVFWDKINI